MRKRALYFTDNKTCIRNEDDTMDYVEILWKIVLPLAGVGLLTWLVARYIPDTPMTRSGCGG